MNQERDDDLNHINTDDGIHRDNYPPPIPILMGSSRGGSIGSSSSSGGGGGDGSSSSSESIPTSTSSLRSTPKPKKEATSSSAAKQKPPRKHSKTGCTLCKLRKIKCDEKHPNCTNCMKRGLQCIYQDPALRRSRAFENSSIQVINTPTYPSPFIPATSPFPIQMNDIPTPHIIETNLFNAHSPIANELPPFQSNNAPPIAITETLLEINNLPKDQVLKELETQVGHGGSLSRKGANYLMTLFPGSSVQREGERFVLSSQDADEYGKYYFSGNNESEALPEKDKLRSEDDMGQYYDYFNPNQVIELDDDDYDETTLVHTLSPLDIILRRVHELKLYSQINFEFVEYFTTQYYAKLSSNFQIQKTWLSVFGLGSNYKHMMHISLAMVALDFYYNASRMYIEQSANKKASIQYKIPTQRLLEDREGYLKLAEFHQTKSLKFFQESISSRNSTFESSITNITSALLQVLYCLFSPNYRISGGTLFSLGSGLGAIYRTGKSNLSEKNAVQMAVYKVAHHYDLSTLPNVNFSQIYFPHYLNDLLELQEFEMYSEPHQSNLRISEYKSHQDRLMQNIEHYQSFISDLYTAYAQVYNNVIPEGDIVPIIIRFVVDCKKELGLLLVEKDPRTLIIVAHFFQLISSMTNPKLASQDIFIDELNNIENNLDDNWKPWLNIPKATICHLAKFDLDFNYDINSTVYPEYPVIK